MADSLWYTDPPPRYFEIPDDVEIPAGDLSLHNPAGLTLEVDEAALAPYEISAEQARFSLQEAVGERVQDVGALFRQLYELGRQAVIAETGADPAATIEAGKAQAKQAIEETMDDPELDAALGELRDDLTAATSMLFGALQGAGRELMAALDSPEGRSALAELGNSLQRFGEESAKRAEGEPPAGSAGEAPAELSADPVDKK